MKYAYALAVVALAVVAATPARALPVAVGSFGFIPKGAVTADNGDLTPATKSTTYPEAFANVPSTGNLNVHFGDVVALNPLTFAYAPGFSTMATAIDVSVGLLTFSFDEVTTTVREHGAIAARWTGELSDGGGLFEEHSFATLSQSCDQVAPVAIINCSNTLLESGARVPEPMSLAILGASLLGLGVLRRRRR